MIENIREEIGKAKADCSSYKRDIARIQQEMEKLVLELKHAVVHLSDSEAALRKLRQKAEQSSDAKAAK